MANKVSIPRFIPQNQSVFDMPAGHWGSNNGINVFVRCPEETHLIMRIEHEINENGVLKPSLGCSGKHAKGMEHFHIWATLEDWDFKAKPKGI